MLAPLAYLYPDQKFRPVSGFDLTSPAAEGYEFYGGKVVDQVPARRDTKLTGVSLVKPMTVFQCKAHGGASMRLHKPRLRPME